jgi:hypothetical protein
VYSWFKSWNQDSYQNGKGSIHSDSNCISRDYNTNIGIFLSYFKFSSSIFSRHRNSNRTLHFFINRYFTIIERKQKGLQDHYKILKNDVLTYWYDKKIKPYRQKNAFHESLIPLYINVIDDLKSPVHFDEMRSHLLDPDNKELNDIFEDFEKREPAHNKKVSEFMGNVADKVRGTITNKDDMLSGSCNDDSGPETRTPNCILRHAVFYYRETQKDLHLDISRLDEDNDIFQLHATPDMVEIGRGNEQNMKCLKDKLISLDFLCSKA